MKLRSLTAIALICVPLMGAQADAVSRVEDIQRVLPGGALTREIPAGEPVTLRVSGVWHNACTPSVIGFEPSGRGRVLNLLWNRTSFAYCRPEATDFSRDIPGVRFEASEIGVLPITVVNTHGGLPTPGGGSVIPVEGMTVLPPFELVVQAPLQQQIGVWPTARQPPEGLFPITARYELSGAWYAPQHPGSGLLLNHERRRAGTQTIDQLWGSWSNFSTDGRPQWHVLSETYWATPTRLLGWVLRAEAEPSACTAQFPNPECSFAARSANTIDIVGIFEINVLGPDRLSLTIDDSGTPLLLGFVQPPVQGYRVELQRL